MNDTIAAVATAHGVGAISIIRLSGTDALSLALKLTKITSLVPRYATLTKIYAEGELIDEALLIYFNAPHSFTGEDVVEFQLHGGLVVANLILGELIKNGARLARAGEFSKRALINGKMDFSKIEAINSLVRRYGGEEEALQTLKTRKAELARYENISFEKSELERKFKQEGVAVNALADKISQARAANLKELEALINSFLKELYMSEISLKINSKTLDAAGRDEVNLSLNETALKNLSSGELNRLRLAFIASESKITGGGEGVIILDEIDANLSGKEAMSIANVLLNLAEFYQIFAISHQPQLSSKADSHFLVEKCGETSNVRELKNEERVSELARMISGERITEEATNFARQLLVV